MTTGRDRTLTALFICTTALLISTRELKSPGGSLLVATRLGRTLHFTENHFPLMYKVLHTNEQDRIISVSVCKPPSALN
jgi:hypothetical protein